MVQNNTSPNSDGLPNQILTLRITNIKIAVGINVQNSFTTAIVLLKMPSTNGYLLTANSKFDATCVRFKEVPLFLQICYRLLLSAVLASIKDILLIFSSSLIFCGHVDIVITKSEI